MKSLMLLPILMILSLQAYAAEKKDLKKDFESLGDNPKVVERVRNLENQQRVRVVQNRLVDRNNRLELAVSYGGLSGGDSYVKTSNLGGMLQYHINPRWSAGVEYDKAYNALTGEGKRQYDQAAAAQASDPNSSQRFPGIDFPLETKMATVSFYPIYGKLNIFDSSIAQFDLYTLLGYGQKTLNSGDTDVFAAGIGSGVWLNRFLTARIEVRYEKYRDLLETENREQNVFSARASMGMLIW
ncbi:MAG: outer membrane beta-barrel domain-containing protein [Bdellovibrionota bacterium]